ncbi:Sporulation kinase A [subsurface metagenome]
MVSLIEGNFNELMQVFTNLIINAKEAIKSIKESGTITIKSYQQGDFVVVQIKDDGIGIPEEHNGKIFDPFFTTKDIGKGTGLGLSIVYRIVENHKGSIEVSSKPQEGSTFTIRMPVKKRGVSI